MATADDTSAGGLVQSIIYERGHLRLLDQTLLPHKVVYEDITTVELAYHAIKDMKVRGAPAIALAAMLAIAVEAHQLLKQSTSTQRLTVEQVIPTFSQKLEFLQSSRPTAVNLKNAVVGAVGLLEAGRSLPSAEQLLEQLITYAEDLFAQDVLTNQQISEHGAKYILSLYPQKQAVALLTHCNTGALATTRYGTALGVLRALHAGRKLRRAFCTETRPYNQGARLTAWECVSEGMPTTLLVDSAVTHLLASAAAAAAGDQKIDAVVVGADRVCRNGDTANKIGTHQIALCAHRFGVPFFVAAPTTTFDLTLPSGDQIVVEERSPQEITHSAPSGQRVVVDSPFLTVWNPSFDVTPAELITGGIITELGVITPTSRSASASAYDLQAWLNQHHKQQ